MPGVLLLQQPEFCPGWGSFLPVKKGKTGTDLDEPCQDVSPAGDALGTRRASCLAAMPRAQPPTAPQSLGPHGHGHWGPWRSPEVLCR